MCDILDQTTIYFKIVLIQGNPWIGRIIYLLYLNPAAGVFINVAKTKYIVRGDLVDTPGTITVDGVPIERVEDFKYLGSYVGSVGRDIEERCKAASRAYGRLMSVWKAPLRVETKLRVFKAMVEPGLSLSEAN